MFVATTRAISMLYAFDDASIGNCSHERWAFCASRHVRRHAPALVPRSRSRGSAHPRVCLVVHGSRAAPNQPAGGHEVAATNQGGPSWLAAGLTLGQFRKEFIFTEWRDQTNNNGR